MSYETEPEAFTPERKGVKVSFKNGPKDPHLGAGGVVVVGIVKGPSKFMTPEVTEKLREKYFAEQDHDTKIVDLEGYTHRQANKIIKGYRSEMQSEGLLRDPEYHHPEPRNLPFPLAAIERWLDARADARAEETHQGHIAYAEKQANQCQYG